MFFYKFSIDVNNIVVVFYFYSRRNKSKRHASCLFINTTVDVVPWQRSVCKILRESRLLLYRRFLAISCIAKKVKDTPLYGQFLKICIFIHFTVNSNSCSCLYVPCRERESGLWFATSIVVVLVS